MEKFTSDCDLGPSDDGFRPVSCRVFYSWCLTRSTLAYEVGPNNQSINQYVVLRGFLASKRQALFQG